MSAQATTVLFRLEFAESLRSRWAVFTGVVYGIVFAGFVWLGLRESSVLGFTGLSRVILNVSNAVVLSVPLVGSPAPDRNVPAGDVKAGAAEDTDLDPAIREASLTLFSAACLRHRTALARLETYERRALSRRRRAIQALAYYTITAEAPQRAPRE